MPMVAASPEKLHCGEAGSSDKEKEVAGRDDAEVMSPQLSDEPLREKAQRIQVMLTGGMSERLPDRGKKLLATLDAIHREQDHRQARGDGARAPVSRYYSFLFLCLRWRRYYDWSFYSLGAPCWCK